MGKVAHIAGKGFASLELVPHDLKNTTGHKGVANNIVCCVAELFFGVVGKLNERVVRFLDAPLGISGGEE